MQVKSVQYMSPSSRPKPLACSSVRTEGDIFTQNNLLIKEFKPQRFWAMLRQSEVSPFAYYMSSRYQICMANCLYSYRVNKRPFAQNFVQNHCSRVQNLHFRFICVELKRCGLNFLMIAQLICSKQKAFYPSCLKHCKGKFALNWIAQKNPCEP